MSILSHARGGYLIPPFGNQRRSGFKPHIAVDKFDLFRIWAYMQKIVQKFQKLNEISKFLNGYEFIFRLTFTPKCCHNTLNFSIFQLPPFSGDQGERRKEVRIFDIFPSLSFYDGFWYSYFNQDNLVWKFICICIYF